MSNKGPRQKGTFSDVRLAVSKKYVLPFPRNRMLALGVGVVVVAVGFAFFNFSFQQAGFVSNGPLSSNHANLEGDCAACHAEFASVTDEKCALCHEKFGDQLGVYTFASHYLYRSNDFQRVVPRSDESPCFTCHLEHEGRQAAITQVPDALCLGCHSFGSFNHQHPQFDFASTMIESESLKFPHIQHVREVMKQRELLDVEKACLHCHNPRPDGKGFEPLSFDRHCDACHLTTADRTPNLPVLRAGTVGVETLESFQKRRAPGTLWAFYTNPNEFRQRGGTVRKGPVYHRDPWITENLRQLRRRLYPDSGLADLLRASADAPAHDLESLYAEAIETLEGHALELRSTPEAAVQRELRQIQELLGQAKRSLRDPYTLLDETEFVLALERPNGDLTGKEVDEIHAVVSALTEPCQQCHYVQNATLRRVEKDQHTLRRAEFDHRAHILERRCLDCHVEIPFEDFLGNAEPVLAAEDRAEILNLPTIETCQACHSERLASNRCVTCHYFHPNKSQRSELLLYLD